MTNRNLRLSNEDIQKLYELLDIARKEQRHQIKNDFSSFEDKEDALRFVMGVGSTTIPYDEDNA